MIAGNHRKEKIGAEPFAPTHVPSTPNGVGGVPMYGHMVIPRVTDHVNHHLAGFRLRRGMLLLIRLHAEMNFVRPAARGLQRPLRSILGKNWRSKKQRQRYDPAHGNLSRVLSGW